MRILYIPIEIKAREFHSRLLLAFYAASRGYACIVGKQSEVIRSMKSFPTGILIDKSISRTKVPMLSKALDGRHKLTSVDEEGIVYADEEYFAMSRFSKETIDMSEKIFCWGQRQKDVLCTYYDDPPCAITGNPRTDLWSTSLKSVYQPSADKIADRHGKYILIPSNFAGYIHANGRDFIFKQRESLDLPKSLEELTDQVGHIGQIFIGFLSLISKLKDRYPDHKILVRPHPSDDQEIWKTLMRPYDNVIVEYLGSIEPYILSATAVIHNGCTTGIQSALMGIPTFAYREVKDARFDPSLPNDSSIEVQTISELFDYLDKIVSGQSINMNLTERRDLWKYHFSVSDSSMASAAIIRELDTISIDEHDESVVYNLRVPKDTFDIFSKKAWKKKIKAAVGRSNKSLMTYNYKNQKFPGAKIEEVRSFFDVLRRSQVGIDDSNISEINDDLFLISPHSH